MAPVSRIALAAAVTGNTLEVYDFTVYTFFAIFIGRTFFPAGTASASLLLSVATFGVGFLTRPIGALVLGAYADRAGRRPALLLTVALMGVGMALLALTPSYRAIGVAAPILVVLSRLIQGFALGGEIGAASAYLVEAAAADRRGLYGGWQIASQGAATLIAGLASLALSLALPAEAVEAWGWRVAVAVGLAVVPVGLAMRRHMPETLAPRAAEPLRAAFATVVTRHRRVFVLGLLTVLPATVSIYVLNYMTTYAIATLHLPASVALKAPLVNGACTAVGALAGGWLSDRFGRKPVLVAPRVALVLLTYPMFILLNAEPGVLTLLLATGVLSLLNGPSSAVGAVILPESLPPAVRGAGFALIYALGVTLFGSTTQVAVTWLIRVTGDTLAPAGYMIVSCVVGVIGMLMLPETHKGDKLRHP